MGGIIFTGYQSSTKKQEAAQANMLYARRDLTTPQKDGNKAGLNALEAEEWIIFKSENELKIRDSEIQISELFAKMKKQKEIIDALYEKKVAYLEAQIKYMKVRLENYEKGPANWESFKRGFNNEMDAIENSLKDLTVNNKK